MPWNAKQLNLFRAAAHNPAIAKSSGVKQSDAERMSKEGLKKMAGGGKAKINRQDTKHGKMDMPFTNLSRYAGMKKGGIMKTRRFDEGGETSAHEIDPDSRRAHGLYDKEPTPKTPAKPALKNYGDETDAGPKEDTRAVSGMASRKYKFKGTDADKERNAKEFPKELATTAVLGGAAKLAQNVYRGVKATAAAKDWKNLDSMSKANEAKYKAREDWKNLDSMSKANEAKYKAREASARNRLGSKDIEDFKKGGMMKESKAMVGKEVAFMKKKGAPASMVKHEKAEMMGMKKGGMPMKNGKPAFLKGMNMGGMAKYAKGGSIRRMADGGMTAPMAPPMAPQAPVDPRQMAAMQAAMQAQGGAPMPPPAPGMKRGGSVRFAKGGGIESRGKTKGTIIRMASGGSVSSASRRADGIAQRGKTRC